MGMMWARLWVLLQRRRRISVDDKTPSAGLHRAFKGPLFMVCGELSDDGVLRCPLNSGFTGKGWSVQTAIASVPVCLHHGGVGCEGRRRCFAFDETC